MDPLKQIDVLVERYSELENQRENIIASYKIMEESYCSGGKLLIAGNGGSAADSEHIVGELMKSFEKPRSLSEKYKEKLKSIDFERGKTLSDKLQGGLAAIALDGHIALSTAYSDIFCWK